MQTWLFGYELQDTAILISKSGLSILSSRKKIDFLKPIKAVSFDGISIELLTRSQEDNDKANISKLLTHFTSSGNGLVLGYFSKEKYESDFAKSVMSAFKSKSKEMVDSSVIFGQLFAIKDDVETQLMKRASDITCTIFSKHLKEKIMDVIDEDKVVYLVPCAS